MRRAILKLGDATTAGGHVLEGVDTCTHDGTPITFIGAKVWCPACDSAGVIGPNGPHQPATMDGKQQALDGDICICKCTPPPVMLASQATAWHEFESHELTGHGSGGNDESMIGEYRGAYDQRFRLTNSRTGQPLRDAPYSIITTDGGEVSGRTDTHGYTQLVSHDYAIDATLHVFEEESPLNPEWDDYP